MTRAQFLNELYHHLYGMTPEQAEQHLTYYAEMLADRVEEGMSEEEAVASMEDVETIARRIMEEDGLPYTPPEARAVTPPAYPDASKLEGGGGTRGYRAPKKIGWRKIGRIALWGLAALVLVSTLGRWALRRHIRNYETTAVPIDSTTDRPIREYFDYENYHEAPYNEGYDYAGEEIQIDSDFLEELDIQWVSGVVYIQSWDGDGIQIQEYSDTALNERTRMSCESDGNTATVRYREGGGLGNWKGSKWLTVLVPDGMLGDLEIETMSARVQLLGLEAQSVNVSTTSGGVTAQGCYVEAAGLQTVSGEVDLSGIVTGSLEIATTSGDIRGSEVQATELECVTISGYTSINGMESLKTAELRSTSGEIYFYYESPSAQSVSLGSTSGDISLSVPYNGGFTLDYTTVSGDLETNGLDLDRQGSLYSYNGGGCKIEVDTVSGDLEIY